MTSFRCFITTGEMTELETQTLVCRVETVMSAKQGQMQVFCKGGGIQSIRSLRKTVGSAVAD